MILIALGANLPSTHGEPIETLAAAKAELRRQGLRILGESKTYLTAPVPVSSDPWYHNEVILIDTNLAADELLQSLLAIESAFGRVRTIVNAPRVLDLDLIAYHDEILNTPDLVLPHPRLHERAFVLYPLKDVAPHWQHPVSGKMIDDLISELPVGQEIKNV